MVNFSVSDVSIMKMFENDDRPFHGYLCLVDRVVYVSGAQPPRLHYVDMGKQVKLNVNSLKSKAQVTHQLQLRNLVE